MALRPVLSLLPFVSNQELIGALVLALAVGLVGFVGQTFSTGITERFATALSKPVMKELNVVKEALVERHQEVDQRLDALQADVTYIKNNGLETKRQLAKNTADISDLRERTRELERI